MSLYEVLKASKTNRFPDYWTQLFAEHVGGKGGWKTITGVLPLTFTAKGGTAVDWVIEGNNDVGENLYDKNTYTAIRARLNSDGEIQEGTLDWQISDYIPIEANENYTISNVVGFSPAYCLYDSNKNYISGNTYANNTNIIFQAPANAAFARFSVKYGSVSGADPNIDVFMVTKGSIAPDHYIPYQQGVGQKTKNLLDTQAYEVGKAWNTSSNANRATATLTVKPNTTYTLKVFETVADLVYIGVKESADATTAVASQQTVNGTVTITTTASAYTLAIQLNKTAITLNDCQNCKITLTEGSTAPSSYIPYGYEIPISVNNTPQTFYIGNSPLTAGQSISKTSTGVDIELFNGENTVSTTLYNKPEMKIKYK